MNSMTGYGKFVVTEQDRQVTIEMKSVNNRFLEINCRVPKSLSVVEDTFAAVAWTYPSTMKTIRPRARY